jgi:mannitol/fructose-specific phosphotransferase system IIA component (Ntr-type)
MLDKQFREAVEKAASAKKLYELISTKENE